MQHKALVSYFQDGLFHAPVGPSPRKIIDIGCGVSADVTLLLARRFPDAQVYGVDLSGVEPEGPVLGNVEFIRGNIGALVDVDERLRAGSADYVFSRFLVAGMTDWAGYVALVARLLAPGGWMEMHDFNGPQMFDGRDVRVSEGWKWIVECGKVWVERGLDLDGLRDVEATIRTAGLTDVTKEVYKLPSNPVPGRPETESWATYVRNVFPTSFVAALDHTFPGEGNAEVRRELAENIWETLKDGDWAYQPMIVAWARKGE